MADRYEPKAVIAANSMFMSEFFSSEPPEHEQGSGKHHERDKLRGRDRAAEIQTPRRIAPVRLNNRPEDGVQERIKPEYLAVELFVSPEKQERGKNEELPAGLHELGGKERHPERSKRTRVGEDDTERAVALRSITAAGKKTAEPPEAVAERNVGSRDVRDLPDGKLVLFHVPDACRRRGKQSSVEHESAFPYRKNVKRISRELMKVGQHIQRARANDRRKEQIDAHVKNAVRVDAFFFRLFRRQVHAEKEPDADHQAVHPDGKRSDDPVEDLKFRYFEKNRVHKQPLGASVKR